MDLLYRKLSRGYTDGGGDTITGYKLVNWIRALGTRGRGDAGTRAGKESVEG